MGKKSAYLLSLFVFTLFIYIFLGSYSDVLALPKCELSYARNPVFLPADLTVIAGDMISVQFAAAAGGGNWEIRVSLSSDQGHIQGEGKSNWDVDEGKTRIITMRIDVDEQVPPGEYSVSIIARGSGDDCEGDDSETKIYRFNVTVAGASTAIPHIDLLDDFFIKGTGDPVEISGVDGIDILSAGAQISGGQLIFTIQVNGALSPPEESASKRIGCYIDTDGMAFLNPPFQAQNFEFLVRTSWFPDEPFAQLKRLVDPFFSTSIMSSVVGDTLTMEIPVASLSSLNNIQWLCYSEFVVPNAELIDVIPNDGLAVTMLS